MSVADLDPGVVGDRPVPHLVALLTPTRAPHGYHDDPCALKKGGRRISRKIVAEEEWGQASELVKEMCVNVSVVKKKASHKRLDRSFTLLNASHLRSH